MNNYIEAVCIGKPMDLPEYNEDTELWEVYFEESPPPPPFNFVIDFGD